MLSVPCLRHLNIERSECASYKLLGSLSKLLKRQARRIPRRVRAGVESVDCQLRDIECQRRRSALLVRRQVVGDSPAGNWSEIGRGRNDEAAQQSVRALMLQQAMDVHGDGIGAILAANVLPYAIEGVHR